MGQVNRVGKFCALIVAAEVRKSSTSSAISVAKEMKLLYEQNPVDGSWLDIRNDGVTAIADTYVVGASGNVLERGVKTLVDVLGWTMDLESVGVSWPNQPDPTLGYHCQVEVEAEDYQGKTRYKVAWINPADGSGGAGKIAGALDVNAKRALQSQFGHLFRAVAGPKQAAPVGAPQAPPAPRPQASPAASYAVPPGPTTSQPAPVVGEHGTPFG